MVLLSATSTLAGVWSGQLDVAFAVDASLPTFSALRAWCRGAFDCLRRRIA
jgi:hypothetical protein